MHVRTLQAAARTGRLDVHFSEQSVFGRPRKVASRAAAESFIRTHYRRFAGQAPCPAPLPSVPPDYDVRLKILRSEFELSQPALARLIGAAGKAVVYQWESRKRTPSPVFWRCFRHQLLLPRPYLVLTKPLRLDIQCQRAASVKIGWKYLDD